jgi:hypothetical protein
MPAPPLLSLYAARARASGQSGLGRGCTARLPSRPLRMQNWSLPGRWGQRRSLNVAHACVTKLHSSVSCFTVSK